MLTFYQAQDAAYQAQDAAKKLARGEDGSAHNAPITVDGALTAYKRDLEAREANPYNAQHPRVHLSKVLLSVCLTARRLPTLAPQVLQVGHAA